jgi:HEAT repeat protein
MDINDGKIAALIAQLDDQDKPTIRSAVDALIPLARESLQLRKILDHHLAETEHTNCWPVAYVLGHLPRPSGACIAKLLETLDHREPDIRWATALLLVRIAKEESAIANRLIELCAAGTGNQKRMALYCVRDLALSDSVSLAALVEALRDSDPTVRVAAAISLKPRPDLDDSAKEILLRVYLNDTDPKVRHAVAITLANLGPPSAEFSSALKKNSESKDRQTRKAAIMALDMLEKRRSAPSGSRSDR